MKRYSAFIILAVAVWVLLVLHVRANLAEGGHDAILYVRGAECFFREGLHCQYGREPFYPLFLAPLLWLPIALEHSIPLLQNLVFLGASFYAFSSVFPSASRAQNFWRALGLAFVPTFLISLNGAGYVESISASLILMLVGSFSRILRAGQGRSQVIISGLIGFFCVFFLSLAKGSFPLVHLGFAFFLFLGALFRPRSRLALGLLAALTLAGYFSSGLAWRQYQGKEKVFERGGAVLFGRTEYARLFQFSADTGVYLVNGLSESFCRKIYRERCAIAYFGAENDYGNSLLAKGISDEELMRRGRENIFSDPLRQFLFVPMEWSKFVFHHTTTGFAWLEMPVLGVVAHSVYFVLLLKIGNLLLYFFVIRRLLKLWRERENGWAGESSPALFLSLAYLVAYLGVYGFATTVIRMVYPVAPLLFLFLPKERRA